MDCIVGIVYKVSMVFHLVENPLSKTNVSSWASRVFVHPGKVIRRPLGLLSDEFQQIFAHY